MNSISVPDDALFSFATALPVSYPVSCLSPPTVQALLSSWVGEIIRLHQHADTQRTTIPAGKQVMSQVALSPVMIWAKLPKRQGWEKALEPLANVEDLSFYLFANKQDEIYSFDLTEFEDDESEVPCSELQLPKISISLPANSYLAKDYFFLVWSTSFQGGFVAQPVNFKHEIEFSLDNLDEYDDYSINPEIENQSLQLICSLEPAFTQQLLQGIEQAIAQTPSPMSDPNLLTQWQQQMAEIPTSSPDLRSLDFLFAAQLQQQEELWQRSQSPETVVSADAQDQDLAPILLFEEAFLSHLGQELRTPLASIKTALSLLNSPNLKPPQRQRYMDLIAKECNRQNTLITNLMNLVELNQEVKASQILQPIQLRDVIPTVVSTYQPLASEKGIRLAYALSDQLPPVTSQTHWLQQMMIHLLNNGIQFTPRGGQVWVRARQEGDWIHLEVRDSGLGIPAGEIPKIFDYFYRTRQADEESMGVGMGLTIVKQLVAHCGGSISVKSRVGEGSTFHILLPIYS